MPSFKCERSDSVFSNIPHFTHTFELGISKYSVHIILRRANCKMRAANISYVNIIYSKFHQHIFDADFESGFFDNFGPSKFSARYFEISCRNFDGPKLSKNPRRKYIGENLNILYSRMKYWLPASYNSPLPFRKNMVNQLQISHF